jgi:hypothetical protein
LDNSDKRKFRWLSSASYPGGCRAEGWTHFAGPIREKIILIEGPLKADVVHHLTGQTVLAVPGVNALTQLEPTLVALKARDVGHIMTAFDMDFLRNFYVQSGYAALTQTLVWLGFRYGTYLWNPDYNGLDDFVWGRLRTTPTSLRLAGDPGVGHEHSNWVKRFSCEGRFFMCRP